MATQRVQVNTYIAKEFVELIDKVARLTGSTRSDLIRRALEVYLKDLKENPIYSSIEFELAKP